MKPFNLYKALLYTIISFIAFPVLAQSGSYTLTLSDLNTVKIIAVPANVPIKITCSYNQNVYADVWTENDENDSDGPDSWQFTTITPEGYIYIYCGDEGNGGPYNFTLNWVAGSYSAAQDSYIHGNSVVDGNISIGALSSPGKLGINGGDKQFSIYSANNNQSPNGSYGIYSYVYDNLGPVYGIYSNVYGGGSSNQRYAGYFYGGDVDVISGNLNVYGNGKLGVGTTTPQAGLQVTQTSNINGNYVSAILGAAVNHWTYFGGTTAGRVRGSNEGYLVVGSNPGGTGDKTLYLNNDTPGNIQMALGGGKVGIGTSPTNRLDVAAVNGEGIRIGKIGDQGNLSVAMGALSAQYNIDFTGYRDVQNDQIGARISALRFNCYTSNNALVQNTGLAFYTNPIATNTGTTDLAERMRISPNGFIGIGTTNPQNMLDVKGTIRAVEVRIESIDKFADFVFEKGYQLPTINQVNNYIQINKHLPNIPTAAEVKENGMSLTEMQVKLLQKVEELTLYMIDQQKTINQQSAKIEELEKKLK